MQTYYFAILFYIFTAYRQNTIMPKATAKKQNRIDVQNLSTKDADILSLDTVEVMKKYKIGKQGVYDRRFALNKKLRAAGLTTEEVLNRNEKADAISAEPKRSVVGTLKMNK